MRAYINDTEFYLYCLCLLTKCSTGFCFAFRWLDPPRQEGDKKMINQKHQLFLYKGKVNGLLPAIKKEIIRTSKIIPLSVFNKSGKDLPKN
jgi:hypothetical protein